jgi:hypothetical protein
VPQTFLPFFAPQPLTSQVAPLNVVQPAPPSSQVAPLNVVQPAPQPPVSEVQGFRSEVQSFTAPRTGSAGLADDEAGSRWIWLGLTGVIGGGLALILTVHKRRDEDSAT